LILRDENDIGTLGQIAEFCEKYELTDLKKIGAAKAEKIQEAMDAYWKANPQG
jgi:phosphopentomutase